MVPGLFDLSTQLLGLYAVICTARAVRVNNGLVLYPGSLRPQVHFAVVSLQNLGRIALDTSLEFGFPD